MICRGVSGSAGACRRLAMRVCRAPVKHRDGANAAARTVDDFPLSGGTMTIDRWPNARRQYRTPRSACNSEALSAEAFLCMKLSQISMLEASFEDREALSYDAPHPAPRRRSSPSGGRTCYPSLSLSRARCYCASQDGTHATRGIAHQMITAHSGLDCARCVRDGA